MNDRLQKLARRPISLLVFIPLVAVGCGGRKFYPVHGKVIFNNGTVLTGGWVVFEPIDSNAKVSAMGDIQPDGTFRLTTEGNGDGAMVGRYRVVIHPPLRSNMDEMAVEPRIVHPKYRQFETSTLEVEVKPDKRLNQITLEMEPPPT